MEYISDLTTKMRDQLIETERSIINGLIISVPVLMVFIASNENSQTVTDRRVISLFLGLSLLFSFFALLELKKMIVKSWDAAYIVQDQKALIKKDFEESHDLDKAFKNADKRVNPKIAGLAQSRKNVNQLIDLAVGSFCVGLVLLVLSWLGLYH